MMTGVITARREAVLRLQVLDAASSGQPIEVEAVIDTGFTGYLTLPGALIRQFALRLHGTREVLLGDGSRVMLDIYRGRVLWDGQPRDVQVLAAEGGALVGMSLLYGHELRLPVIDGGVVTIQALP
jgi:clan AA aspartic protease